MGTLPEVIRKHHRSLAKTLKAHARAVGGSEPETERHAFVAFLKNDLLAHARAEERHLYAAVDKLVSEHGRPTATMMVDHEFINDYVSKIELAIHRLDRVAGAERARLSSELRELAVQLAAIVDLHLAKEERVYLPLIERHLSDSLQHQILASIHENQPGEKEHAQ